MKAVAKFTTRWAWNLIGWIPAAYYHLQAKNLGAVNDYQGRHRLEYAGA